MVLVFNPFHFFTSQIPLRKLSYEFTFRTPDRIQRYKAHLSVVPVFYETKTELMIPVRGRVLVWDGHDVNENGLMYSSDPKDGDDWFPGKSDRNEDYYGFGVKSVRR